MKKEADMRAPGGRPVFVTGGRRWSAFTLIELLVVIAIIGVLASLIVGLSSYAGRKMRESRIRSEMTQLITAIEAYHAKFGHYPPDGIVAGTNANPAINPLYYELTGTVVDNAAATFRLPNREVAIPAAKILSTFGVEGFVNSSPDPKRVKSFADFKASQHQTLATNDVEVELLKVPVDWNRSSDQPTSRKGLNPWRYVSKNPTNNPTSFDLWAEYLDGAKIKIICNWSKEILERP